MTIKELRNYLQNFEDTDEVAVSMWGLRGQSYYMPHLPCSKPVTFKPTLKDIKRVAVVGFFDDCLAHMVKSTRSLA